METSDPSDFERYEWHDEFPRRVYEVAMVLDLTLHNDLDEPAFEATHKLHTTEMAIHMWLPCDIERFESFPLHIYIKSLTENLLLTRGPSGIELRRSENSPRSGIGRNELDILNIKPTIAERIDILEVLELLRLIRKEL